MPSVTVLRRGHHAGRRRHIAGAGERVTLEPSAAFSMNRTRIAQLGILAVLVAVWVSSATLPPPASPPAPAPPARAASQAMQPARARPPRDATTFDLHEAAERLHA